MEKGYSFFLMTDQPSTGPYCSARTDTIGDFYHTLRLMLVQQCLNPNCKRIIMEVEDNDV